MSNFSRLLRNAGLTLKEAETELGVSERQLRRYETGNSTVPVLVQRELQRRAQERRSARVHDAKSFRFIDLFAGIGGLRIGFEAIGGQCVFTSEWDKFSRATYEANFPDCGEDHVFAGDIRPYGNDPASIPEHDVLLAGFPCQPFSLAGVSKKNSLGRPHGFLCEQQGNLFFDIARIIKHHRPAAFLLENVKNLERHDKGETFATIRDVLENELGYKIDFRVISSRPWVPQKRERIFIVGFREDQAFSFDGFSAVIPPETEWPVLGDILQGHNEIDQKYTLSPHLWEYLQAYREKHSKAGNGFGCSVFGPSDVARTLSARYHKDGSEILIGQEGTRPRRLTPTECARLMGFETETREWKIPVSDTQAYRQFGNAVVVPVVEAIARYMEPFIRKALASDRGKVESDAPGKMIA